ncbi:MAG: ATP-binding protein [Alphaproteobacteria bacterium]|nr:ATP-binding protein [Alphaproteobacteria bacterium]
MTRLHAVFGALRGLLHLTVDDVAFAVPDPDPALHRLAEAYQLSRFEVDLLLAALLPSLDDRIGDALVPIAGRRVFHVGLAIRGLARDRPVAQLRDHLSRSVLWRQGLLEPSDEPVLQRPMQPSPILLDAIEGRVPQWEGASLRQGSRAGAPGLTIHPARPTTHALRDLWREPRAALIVRFDTDPRPEDLQRAALWAVAQASALVVDCPSLTAITLPDGWGAHTETHLLVVPGTHVHGGPPGTVWRAESRLRAAEQRDIWLEAGAAPDDDTLGRLANFTFLRQETVQQVVQRVAGRDAPGREDWISAIREISPPPSARFATTTEPRVPWDRLVLPERPRLQLDALVHRVRYRSLVQGEWGLSSPDGRGDGVVGVFHGESGTGKTFAVEAMATRLGMPVMRVDLSRVVSKYIGETEKHLSELFDCAEGFRALLCFDEADAMFGKRTGVKDAHDRYANIETNYLLQRLELFDGLAILATNLMQNLDEAFLRRLHYVVYFPNPDAPARLRLWRQHLPSGRLAEDVDLDHLARSLDLVGGDIRNAATEAAYRAAAREGSITRRLLADAISDELLKKGKSPPLDLGGPDADSR